MHVKLLLYQEVVGYENEQTVETFCTYRRNVGARVRRCTPAQIYGTGDLVYRSPLLLSFSPSISLLIPFSPSPNSSSSRATGNHCRHTFRIYSS